MDCEQIDMTGNRDHPIWCAQLAREFPAPSAFDGLQVSDRSRRAMDIWCDAPWFYRDAVELVGLCEKYTDDEGWLPCGVPVGALVSFAWLRCFCFRDSDLSRGRSMSLAAARRAFVASALAGLGRFGTYVGIPRELGVDAFQYRTFGEVGYVKRLAALDKSLVESWVDVVDVDDRALCFGKPQLSVDFRFVEKATSQYWSNFVRNERRVRETTGYAVPYQYLTQNNITVARRGDAFARLTVGWSRIEVPMGCYAELPPVFSYKGSAMMDPRSGYWVVGYTEFVAKTVAFVLFDAYDNFRLWRLSPRMIEFMWKLDLKPVLGSERNIDEFEYMLGMIEDTDFKRLPQHWGSRSKRRDVSDLSGRGVGADWFYYNPYSRKAITEREFEVLRNSPRPIRPINFPSGFDHDVPLPGWDEEEGSDRSSSEGRMEGEEVVEVENIEADNAEEPAANARACESEDRSVGSDQRTAIIRDFLVDVGLPESSLSGEVSELRGYLRGRLGL